MRGGAPSSGVVRQRRICTRLILTTDNYGLPLPLIHEASREREAFVLPGYLRMVISQSIRVTQPQYREPSVDCRNKLRTGPVGLASA